MTHPSDLTSDFKLEQSVPEALTPPNPPGMQYEFEQLTDCSENTDSCSVLIGNNTFTLSYTLQLRPAFKKTRSSCLRLLIGVTSRKHL